MRFCTIHFLIFIFSLVTKSMRRKAMLFIRQRQECVVKRKGVRTENKAPGQDGKRLKSERLFSDPGISYIFLHALPVSNIRFVQRRNVMSS